MSSKAHIRTLFEEERYTILAERQARISHHESKQVKPKKSRFLQVQLLQQNLDFREAHQRNLTEMWKN